MCIDIALAIIIWRLHHHPVYVYNIHIALAIIIWRLHHHPVFTYIYVERGGGLLNKFVFVCI